MLCSSPPASIAATAGVEIGRGRDAKRGPGGGGQTGIGGIPK
jgi:hypothetical protein